LSELLDRVSDLSRPQALIKKLHANHYMKDLHEAVHRDEQAQGVMGLRHRKLRSAWEIIIIIIIIIYYLKIF
jgi:hypothetical protein